MHLRVLKSANKFPARNCELTIVDILMQCNNSTYYVLSPYLSKAAIIVIPTITTGEPRMNVK